VSGADLNEYHADFLARDRLADARASAARHELIRSLRPRRPRRPLRVAIGLTLIRVGAWLIAITARG
jgi:hypothetical protein